MMKQIDLVVFTQYPNAYAPIRLGQEAMNKDIKFRIYNYEYIKQQGATLRYKLPDAKCVILREPNLKLELYKLRDEILKFYKSRNSYILNHKSYLKWSVLDKITQTKEFEKAGIPHIKMLKITNAKKINLKYPYIVKNKLGSHGDSVYKIENKDDLENVLKKHKLKDLLFQEFQTAGFDLRVIVLGACLRKQGKVLGIMKRTPRKGEFLSNFSQGGAVQKYTESDNAGIEKISIQAAKHFKLDYVGVDLMLGNDGQWKVLEVNRACQFKGFEKATDVNVAKELISFIMCYTTGYAKNIGTSGQNKTKQKETNKIFKS